jgi:hypothetical protein
MVKNHYLRAKTNLKVLFRRFRGLITQIRTLNTHFLPLSKRKERFEAKYPEALRGSRVHCNLRLELIAVYKLKLMAAKYKNTMTMLVEDMINERWEKMEDSVKNELSAKRVSKEFVKLLKRIIW